MKLEFIPDALDVNSGVTSQIFMGVAGGGWRKLLHSTTRDPGREKIPTLRERLDYFNAKEPCRLFLHNPFGIFPRSEYGVDMWFDQIGMNYQRALKFDRKANPQEWEYIKNRANVLEFVEACQDLPYERTSYVGNPQQFKFLSPGESQASWLKRAKDAIWPVLEGCTGIGLDAFMGSRPHLDPRFNGPNGCSADFTGDVLTTHELMVEVSNYISDEWLSLVPKVLGEGFLRRAIASNPPGAKEWTHRLNEIVKETGLPVDHEPLQAVGAKGETVWVLVETHHTMSDQEKVDKMNRARQDFPDYRIIVYSSDIPAGEFE